MDEVPLLVGQDTGNTVCYVVTPAPCLSKVAEMLTRRKFLCVAPAAFAALKKMLTEFYE